MRGFFLQTSGYQSLRGKLFQTDWGWESQTEIKIRDFQLFKWKIHVDPFHEQTYLYIISHTSLMHKI